MESTQLESSLTHSHVEGEGEGEISRSPSPTSSLYSASFHSESELSGDEDEGGRRESVDNPCSLSESQHLADLNTQRDDLDKGLNSGVNTTTDPVMNTEETKSLKEDGRKEGAAEARPELVTRGGVRIIYQLGPVSTSERGTQTDEPLPQRGTQTDEPATTDTPQSGTETDQQAIANTPESETQTNEQANAEIATAEDKQAVESTRAVEDTSDPANPTPLPQAANKANETEEEDKPEQTAEEEKTSTEVGSVQVPESEIQPEKENESTPPSPADTSHTLPSLFNVSNNTTDTGDTKRANKDDSELTQVQNTARESLSSSEDNEPPADRSELDSISRSTLTDVSERTSISPDSSSSNISPSPPPAARSQTDLSERADKVNHKEHQVAENQPEETEKCEVVGEEEFTKAWT